MWRLVVIAAFSALSWQSATAQQSSALLGMTTENEALAWQAVGRLDSEQTGFCTGTLIAADLVLTAAHCVYSAQTGEQVNPEDMVFRAGLRQDDVVAERRVSQIEAHPAYAPLAKDGLHNIRHDMALVRLAEPISTLQLDPIVVHDRDISIGTVSVVSYGRDREMLPSRQDVCRIKRIHKGVMVLSCAATFGSSGAPVFRSVNGNRKIVSVISSGGSYQGKPATFGMVLPELVAELKHRMWVNKPKPAARIKRLQVGSSDFGSRETGAKFVRP